MGIVLVVVITGMIVMYLRRKGKQPEINLNTDNHIPVYRGNTSNVNSPLFNIKNEENYIVKKRCAGNLDINELFIPHDILSLLWVRNDYGTNCAEADEPSLIDTVLKIDNEICQADEDISIGYYPSYRGLTPKQRYIYLHWLTDITQSVDIGYVFIFYYGLERHLFMGKYEEAFHMILRLRKLYKNGSFLSYSEDALLLCALYHKRKDLAELIEGESQVIKAFIEQRYLANDLIGMAKSVGFTNMRYIKMVPKDFEHEVEILLIDKFGDRYYPINADDIKGITQNKIVAIANISLDNRFSTIPDITSNPSFRTSVYAILNEAHQIIKENRKSKRKNNA